MRSPYQTIARSGRHEEMTEVSPEELEKYSKPQLIAFIEQQNEQLTRFDGRFRGNSSNS